MTKFKCQMNVNIRISNELIDICDLNFYVYSCFGFRLKFEF